MKVLIITYYWPPSGGGGVQRWLKFAANLDKLGSTPVVFTPSNPDVPIIDESLESEVPSNILVLKTPIFEPSLVLPSPSQDANKTGSVNIWLREGRPVLV